MRNRIGKFAIGLCVILLAGCGGLQPAAIPEVNVPGNLNNGATPPAPAPTPPPAAPAPTPTPAPEATPAPVTSADRTASADEHRQVVLAAQRSVDNSRRNSPGAGRNLGCVFDLSLRGEPNALGLRLRRVNRDGSPAVDDHGNPVVDENPGVVLVNPRSSGDPYQMEKAFFMYPEDAGEDQVEAQIYKINLTPTPGREDVHGENVWYAIEISPEIEAALKRNVPMRLRFEDKDGKNLFFSAGTFTALSTARGISNDSRLRWRIMPSRQPDGSIAHDPVICDPTDNTVQPFLVRARYQDNRIEP